MSDSSTRSDALVSSGDWSSIDGESSSDTLSSSNSGLARASKDAAARYRSPEHQLKEQQKLSRKLALELQKRAQEKDAFLSNLSDYLGCDVQTLDDALSIVEHACSQGSDSDSDLNLRLESTTSMLERSERENRKLHKALQKYEQMFVEASEIGDDADPAKLVLRIKKLEQLVEDRDKEIEELNKVIESLKSENKDLSEMELRAKDQLIVDSQIQLAKTECERLVHENSELSEMVGNMRTRIAELGQQTQALAKELVARNEDIENLVKYGDKKNDELQEAKQTIKELKESMSQKEIEMAAMATEISELKLKKVEKLYNRVETPKVSPKKPEPQTDELMTTISAFEEVFEQQGEEIVGLYDAKMRMVHQMRRIHDVLKANEVYTESVVEQARQLKRENDELRQALRHTNQKREKEVVDVLSHVIAALPEKQKMQVKELLQEGDPSDVTSHVITALLAGVQEKQVIIDELVKREKTLSSQNAALADELNEFVRYVRRVGNHWCEQDETPRTMILSECARLSSYLDEISSASQKSPKDLAELAMSVLQDHDIGESPFTEIMALISILVEVNSILLDNIDELRSAHAKGLAYEEREELMSQIDELQKYKEQALEVENSVAEMKHAEQAMSEIRQDYEAKIASLQKQNSKLKQHIHQVKKQEETERNKLCKRADKMVTEIENKVVEDQQQYEESIEKLNDENQEYRDEIERLRDEHGTDVQKLADIILAKKEKIRIAKDKIKGLQQNLHELNAQLLEWQHRCSEKDKDIEEEKTLNSELSEKLDRIAGKAQRRKEELKLVQAEKVEVIDEIKQRNEELKGKYDGVISQLESDLSKLREDYEIVADELKNVSHAKQQLVMERAKLHVSEKALTMKVNALAGALERERSEYQDRKAAMQSSFNGTLQAKDKELAQYKSAVNDIVNIALNMGPDEVSLQDLASAVSQRMEEIRQQKSVVFDCKACDKLADELQKRDAVIKSLQKQVADCSNQNRKLKDLDFRLGNATSENALWEKWSKTLYAQVTLSPAPKLATPADLRFALEESVLSSVSRGQLNRKLDILRSEKKIINIFKVNTMRGFSDRSKCRSLRPVMIVMIFKKRLEQLSGKAVPRLATPKTPRAAIVPVDEC